MSDARASELEREVAPLKAKIQRMKDAMPRQGTWSAEEKEIMREIFTHKGWNADTHSEALKRLQRTSSQIRAMCGNMGLYYPWGHK